jgi:hypothetical protein
MSPVTTIGQNFQKEQPGEGIESQGNEHIASVNA